RVEADRLVEVDDGAVVVALLLVTGTAVVVGDSSIDRRLATRLKHRRAAANLYFNGESLPLVLAPGPIRRGLLGWEGRAHDNHQKYTAERLPKKCGLQHRNISRTKHCRLCRSTAGVRNGDLDRVDGRGAAKVPRS